MAAAPFAPPTATPGTSPVAQLQRQPAADRARQLARRLVGVQCAPPGSEAVHAYAEEAGAYHSLAPYPWFHFREWKTEERGPLPRCMPFVRSAVRRSAKWLFGKPLEIKCPGNTELEETLRKAWQANRMPTRMVVAAERAGQQGGVALKFSYDETADPQLSFQTLSITQELRCYYDPHDRDRLLMARVQYPYFDPLARDWYWYREEWTAEEEVHYEPVRCKFTPRMTGGLLWPSVPVVADSNSDPDKYERWVQTSRDENPFGLIPITPVKNLDVDDAWGIGDLWGLFRVVDRVNLTYHGMDRSNQFDSTPLPVFIDVNAEQADLDRPLAPGQPLSLKSDETAGGDSAKGQVDLLEPRGSLRPHMMDYAKDLRTQILLAAGNVEVDQAEFTNKGNLTQAVLAQLYGPLIEQTDEKRKTYGEDGIGKFLESCAVGLARFGADLEGLSALNEDDHDSFDVQLGWPSYFALTEEEKTQVITRTTLEIGAGLMNHERALETVARVEGIEDLPAFKEEMADVVAVAAEGQEQAVGPQPEEPTNGGQSSSNK